MSENGQVSDNTDPVIKKVMSRESIVENILCNTDFSQIPVFFSKPQDSIKKLYVFQYPLRSVSTVDVEKPHVTAVTTSFVFTSIVLQKFKMSCCLLKQARIKPKLQEVELELKVQTDTPNYDHSKGEQIVINTDGFDKHQNPDHLNYFEG